MCLYTKHVRKRRMVKKEPGKHAKNKRSLNMIWVAQRCSFVFICIFFLPFYRSTFLRSSNTTFPLSESYFVASFFEGLFSSDKMYKWFLSKDDDERTVYYDLESCVPTKK